MVPGYIVAFFYIKKCFLRAPPFFVTGPTLKNCLSPLRKCFIRFVYGNFHTFFRCSRIFQLAAHYPPRVNLILAVGYYGNLMENIMKMSIRETDNEVAFLMSLL